MFVLAALFLLICLGLPFLRGVLWFIRTLNDGWYEWCWTERLGFLGVGLVAISSPYTAFKIHELNLVFERVPDPLRAIWIEYREEKSWGHGLPGDAETGVVVYRLTDGSARRAQAEGDRLRESLPGGYESWHPTPIANWDYDGSPWRKSRDNIKNSPHGPDIKEYLDKYAPIPIDQQRIDEINQAIRTTGSFYSYGRGGSITIVSPMNEKVYFAFAG